ncbi:TolC family protein [Algoriphagus winogradskyi]|uniref:Outer membrane protein TolC n=1 Tax=Algoriphagus winogradskyi TaxID=237017 RepID=A0ABY1P3V7_9BACT|nr:TolC family protein [Algoriphagus winogradskyi]SMP25643.1 Outer membrane protein TolC [Algoriphagus winogradskyi]
MKRSFFTFLLLIFGLITYAQDSDTLRFEDYMEWVKSYHPISAQADIMLTMGDMEVRTARGGFDPLLYGNLDEKSFDEKSYYDKREAGISIPTWAGIEINGAFEQNSGQYLNPENSVPTGGLLSAGASINLGQGLILDDRRAGLRKAQIYQQSTESERQRLLNELYLQATGAYWNWSLAFANRELQAEGVELAKVRFRGIKISFEQGDFPAIDTVEAATQLLNREYNLQKAENELFMRTQDLNNFLWDETGNPIALDVQVKPEELFSDQPLILNEEELRIMIADHPELLLADFELASLDVERRLKAQQIIPVVKLKYNFLTENLNQFDQAGFFENNYKWGLTVYTPLMWRKARGGMRLAEAKIDFKQNSRDLKELQLRTKLENELNCWSVINNQIATYTRNVAALQMLLQGELRRFEIGESSLFLVNSREVSVFSSRVTLNELLSKRKITYAKTRFAAGVGFE